LNNHKSQKNTLLD